MGSRAGGGLSSHIFDLMNAIRSAGSGPFLTGAIRRSNQLQAASADRLVVSHKLLIETTGVADTLPMLSGGLVRREQLQGLKRRRPRAKCCPSRAP
jgi:hypothetical protein